jgi:tRNA-dihydrouridine synthase
MHLNKKEIDILTEALNGDISSSEDAIEMLEPSWFERTFLKPESLAQKYYFIKTFEERISIAKSLILKIKKGVL